MPDITNTAGLRKMLLDVIKDVRGGNMNYKDAGAISALSGRILESARLDFEVMKMGPVEVKQKLASASLMVEESEGAAEDQENDEHPEYIGRRDKGDTAVWYPDDWATVKGMLSKGKTRQEIATDFGVSLHALDEFIEKNGDFKGEASAPVKAGARH